MMQFTSNIERICNDIPQYVSVDLRRTATQETYDPYFLQRVRGFSNVPSESITCTNAFAYLVPMTANNVPGSIVPLTVYIKNNSILTRSVFTWCYFC